ncbi:MBL fold metallo-hydrolase [Halobellus sp. GM3]|uniref:MBL fold metallo-hydrolase n=1 Tax=Halobellus sp. GM3 TaxID=3458410 RepID=UPI00403DA31C
MDVTILGSGSPIPDPTRSGTSLVVETGDELVLIDCGPNAVEGLLEEGINPKEITTVLFTHQHMDHNASFFHFAISSWVLGRETLTVYGPEGTSDLVDAMYQVYETDFEYRESLGRSTDGVTEIETVTVDEEFSVRLGDCRVSALPVDHSIETYGYRLDDVHTGDSFVFTGDTAPVDGLPEFAAGADVLLHDCCLGPMLTEPPEDKPTWEQFFDPDEGYLDRLGEVHCTPEQCGEIATDANADTLVLTHLTPYLDVERVKQHAQAAFDGRVLVAEDGLSIEVPYSG